MRFVSIFIISKGQGACFLFHCGPAVDFRCKFTKHANYTSAVFSIDKKVPPPPPLPIVSTKKPNNAPIAAMSQNEIDLKSLKGKSSESIAGSAKLLANDATAATITTTIKSKIVSKCFFFRQFNLIFFKTHFSDITATVKNATSHCSRFQFQCHSGDCIAVYNACDGIPQCDDGSDEGLEVWIAFISIANNNHFVHICRVI